MERVSQVCLSAPEGEPHHLRHFRWWKSGGVSDAAEFLTLQKNSTSDFLALECSSPQTLRCVGELGLCFIDVKHWWRNRAKVWVRRVWFGFAGGSI